MPRSMPCMSCERFLWIRQWRPTQNQENIKGMINYWKNSMMIEFLSCIYMQQKLKHRPKLFSVMPNFFLQLLGLSVRFTYNQPNFIANLPK